MNTLEFLSQYLSSPIVAHRNMALLCLFKEAIADNKTMKQLAINLRSKNLDTVINTLRIFQAVSLRKAESVAHYSKQLTSLGKTTNHFGIANICKDILMNSEGASISESIDAIAQRLTPKVRRSKAPGTFFDNCDYSLEYSLGAKSFKYELSDICRTFHYDCRKAA